MDPLHANEYESNYLPQQLYLKICLSVLEEAIDQLSILKIINKIPDASIKYESYRTVEERFSERVVESAVEGSMDKEQKELSAFHKNFVFIMTTLKTTFNELLEQGSFEKLLTIINVHKMLKNEENNLRMDTQKNQNELKKLEHALYQEKICYHKKIEERMVATGILKDQIQDFMEQSEVKTRYIKQWESAKIEELETALERKEKEKIIEIKTIKVDMVREMRIHQEILSVLNEMQEDLEKQIAFWEEKYETDVREFEEKIKALKEKKEEQRNKMNQLKDIYSKRQAQIDDFKQYKIEQEQKRIELEIRNKAATKIQAWWRGTMVRKGFGKFRKKKDKKGKKSGSEKKDQK